MPKLDLDTIPQTNHTNYPAEYRDAVAGRWVRRLAPASGISDFGFSHVTLKPGTQSSQRHWHEGEDEFVVILSGEAVLIEDRGETAMRPGDIAAFAKGVVNGHVLVNRSAADCVFLAVGRVPASPCHYPDIDLHFTPATGYRHKDGSGFGG